MAKSITITNGSGSGNLINGSYNVTSQVNGYDNTSILPASITVDEQTTTYSFTISANGTLTLHVTEDGTESGTPIVGATFIRTDSTGNEYGTEITTDANGDAIFDNVPFAQADAPIIYYKQTASDGDHEFINTVVNTQMTTETQTLQIQNSLGALRTINLTDANYANLPIENGTINLEN